MAKTKRYFLEVENIENEMLSKMELTKKEFERQLKFMQGRVKATENEEEQNKIELRVKEYDSTTFVETDYYFTNCCCDTILSKYECKKGYEWRI